MADKEIPTLYRWAGGSERLEMIFQAFYDRVPSDPVLGPVFAGMAPEHFETVAHFPWAFEHGRQASQSAFDSRATTALDRIAA